MTNLTLEGIRQFIERFPDNLIAQSWNHMLLERLWEMGDDLDAFSREADCLFYDGQLEMQDIGEYWTFRKGFLERRKIDGIEA